MVVRSIYLYLFFINIHLLIVSITTIIIGSVAANDEQTDALENDLISALLGGALQSLLDSRFAFTPAVAIRSRYRDQIGRRMMMECVLTTHVRFEDIRVF